MDLKRPWEDGTDFERQLSSLSDRQQQVIYNFYGLHRLLYEALPQEGSTSDPGFAENIKISEYGEELMDLCNTDGYTRSDKCLAALILFYHRDFLVDLDSSSYEATKSVISKILQKSLFRLPNRFLREFYDKFYDLPGNARIEEIEASAIDALLDGSEQGIYQIGKDLTGPLGIIESLEGRFLPPSSRLPLWHCSDPGCMHLHQVAMQKHYHPAFSLAAKIGSAARSHEGQESVWEGAVERLEPAAYVPNGRAYNDLIVIIAEALSVRERASLFDVILGQHAKTMRDALSQLAGLKNLAKQSDAKIANALSDRVKFQLILILPDSDIIFAIDKCIFNGRIIIPFTEVREAKSRWSGLSSLDARCSISSLGIRSNYFDPVVQFCSLVWECYSETGQISQLAWLCRQVDTIAEFSEPMAYLKDHSLREAVINLILSNRPVTIAVTSKLKMEYTSKVSQEEIADRILWKFGFNPRKYDLRYQRFDAQLQLLLDEAIRSGEELNEDKRDAIRSRGVNVFVSVEFFLEELIAFNVWVLASDHFADTKFRYNRNKAIKLVSKVLGPTYQKGRYKTSWNTDGGNELGTLLIYCRLAADWMKILPTREKAAHRRRPEDMPHFAAQPVPTFPLLHYELWADAATDELKLYVERFESIVANVESAKLAEIRNGLDHFREAKKFPTTDNIIACTTRLRAFLNEVDDRKMLAKIYWVEAVHEASSGLSKYDLIDYKSRKHQIGGPSPFIGINKIDEPSPFNHFKEVTALPVIIPFGNLLGRPNGEFVFTMDEESEYSLMWTQYPRRRTQNVVSSDVAILGEVIH